jgi:hypothetical protein
MEHSYPFYFGVAKSQLPTTNQMSMNPIMACLKKGRTGKMAEESATRVGMPK